MFIQLVFWFYAVFGYGRFLRKNASLDNQLVSGLALLFLFASVLPIFTKLTLLTTLLVGSFGITLFFYRELKEGLYTHKVPISFMLIGAFFISGISLRAIHTYDAGLYHIPHMKFLIDEGIIKGMANISHRYGFNSLLLPFSSLLIWDKVSLLDYRLGANLILLIVLTILFYKIRQMNVRSPFGIFSVVFSSGVLVYYKKIILSPGTDITSGLLILLFFWILFEKIDTKTDIGKEDIDTLGLITALVICFKITNSLVFIPLSLVIISQLRNEKLSLKSILFGQSFIMSFLIGGFWLIQNVLISGCLAYPLAITCLEPSILPWALGPGPANTMVSIIKGWNRKPGPEWTTAIEGWDWVGDWVQRSQNQLLIALLFLFILWTLYHVLKKNLGMMKFSLLVSSFLIPTMIVWFFGAPDPRFLDPYMKILVIGCLLMGVNRLKVLSKIKLKHFVWLISLGANVALITSAKYITRDTIWGLVEIPKPQLEVMEDGMTRLPQNGSDQCWAGHRFCQPQRWNALYQFENDRLKYINH